MNHHRRAASALVACTVLQAGAYAQGAGTSDGSASGTLEEIVVTAERRTQDLLKTPISVVALTGDMLNARGVTDINTLQSQVPSVSFADYGNVKFLNIRGVGVSEGAPNQSVGVAVHWDGTYVAREFVFGDSFFDVASVEVLRGPQGTYTGQNASGGAIYINSVRPDFEAASGFANVTFGNLGRKQASAGSTFQLSDTVAARISGKLERKESAFTNLGPAAAGGPVEYHSQPGNLDQFVGRAQLLFRPTDDVELLLIHQNSSRKTDGLATQSFNGTVVGNRTVAYDSDQALDTSYSRTSAVLDFGGFEAFDVRVMAAYQTTEQLSIRDNDFVATPGGSSSKIIIHDRYYTGEIDLISHDDQRLTWTTGVTFLNYEQPGVTVPSINTATPFGQGLYIFTDARRRNEAIFLDVGYDLTPQLELKLGGRYSRDHVGFVGSYLQPFGVGGFTLPLNPGIEDFSESTGRAVINWEPTDDQLFYATVSKGYKPGGTTPFGVDYDAERVINYEAGWKAGMFGRTLTASLSAFYMEYENFQATFAADINNPATAITRNVKGTEIQGVEGQIAVSTGGFHADVSFSVLDAQYGDLAIVQPAGLFGNGQPATPQLINLKGRTIPFAAEFSGAIGLSYEIPVGSGMLTPLAQLTYQGSQWVNFFQAPYNRIPSRTLASARLTYDAAKAWSVTAYVDNLLDEDYLASVDQSTDGIGSYVLGQPREFGVTLSYTF